MEEPIPISSSTNFLHKLMNDLPEESKWIIMQGLPYMRQAKIYDLILQLEQDILKKVVVKKGKDSDEYKFFMAITNALYQAGEAVNLTDTLHSEIIGMKQYNDFLHERNAKLEIEINRWRTIEELAVNDTLEVYINRTKEILTREKKQ